MDGDGQRPCGGDCNDLDPLAFSGASETCDGQDTDCNGMDDAGSPGVDGQETDDDGDGWWECQSDCDDTNVNSFAGAIEICDGFDNDCDRIIDEDCFCKIGDVQRCFAGPPGVAPNSRRARKMM